MFISILERGFRFAILPVRPQHLFRVMKLTLFFLFVFCIQVSAHRPPKRILPAKNRIVTSKKTDEVLRQEREIFDQNIRHAEQKFQLQLVMDYSVVLLVFAIFILGTIIILNHRKFPKRIVAWAGPALFIYILGWAFTLWKILLH